MSELYVSLKMQDPLHSFRASLTSLSEVHERCKHADEIKKHLREIKVINWRALYINDSDGTFWVQEFPFSELHGGGLSCFYEVTEEDPYYVLESEPHLTSAIKNDAEARSFWDSLGFEEGSAICKASDCSKQTIKFSTFCRRHHFESIRQEACPY